MGSKCFQWLRLGFGLGILLFIVIQTTPLSALTVSQTEPIDLSIVQAGKPNAGTQVFLPFIRGGVIAIVHQPLLIGSYPVDKYLGDQSVVDQFLIAQDAWAGLNRAANKGHSLAGTFMALEDPYDWYNIPQILNTTWNNGYTPFANIMPDGRTAAAIAGGCCDAKIQAWADYYLAWTNQGGNRRAFIAPMPEMNGDWTVWGMNPTSFKAAYARIQSIFESRGVTRNKIWWVFAPNGWSTPPYDLNDYYPGDAMVDIIGFSSYNHSCRTAWMTPSQVFDPYIQEIRTQVTTNKPIFVAQTASASAGGNKDQWIRDAYTLLYQQGVRAVLYFNGNKDCDWAVYRPDQGAYSTGYRDAVSSPNTHYIPPATLAGTVLPP